MPRSGIPGSASRDLDGRAPGAARFSRHFGRVCGGSCMHRRASLATVILLAIAAVAPLARAQGMHERRAEARATLAAKLHEYAEWCRGRQYFLERRRVLEAVLVLAPEDA